MLRLEEFYIAFIVASFQTLIKLIQGKVCCGAVGRALTGCPTLRCHSSLNTFHTTVSSVTCIIAVDHDDISYLQWNMQWFKGLFTGLSSSKEENSNMTTTPYFLLYVWKTEIKLQGSNLWIIYFIFIVYINWISLSDEQINIETNIYICIHKHTYICCYYNYGLSTWVMSFYDFVLYSRQICYKFYILSI